MERVTDGNEMDHPVRRVLDSAIDFAKEAAKDDGRWYGELQANATVTAEYIFLRQALGQDFTSDRDVLRRWLLSDQRPDGSWSIASAECPGDVSTTVEAYLALRILNTQAKDPAMERAKQFITEAGGVEKVRMFTRFYLAMFGLFPWNSVPEMPPELILVRKFQCILFPDIL